ncbi:MAG: hypothetical protein QG620_439 [Patescibacteria group bacterium]|nr:hypothetical protein [Patescibacteria group bacterium]
MGKTKIFFAYKHTDEPWGGANNFIRTLYSELEKDSEFAVHHDADSNSGILFFSHLSYGPGNVALGSSRLYPLSLIKKLKKKSGAKLVVRAVNLRVNSEKPGLLGLPIYLKNGLISDINTIKLVNLADFVIFQSEFQRSFFKKWGYGGKNDTVIHNGAPAIFQNDDYISGKGHHEPLRLVSNSNFKTFKRHDIVAKISLLEGTSVIHVGRWSDRIKNHKVDVRGTLTHEEIREIYKNCDYLLHPAVYDPCPNSVVEALHFGLPVIYSNKEGSSEELVRGNGVAIDENDLKKTIQLAKENFTVLKQKLSNDRGYYSIGRAVTMYKDAFNKFKK